MVKWENTVLLYEIKSKNILCIVSLLNQSPEEMLKMAALFQLKTVEKPLKYIY